MLTYNDKEGIEKDISISGLNYIIENGVSLKSIDDICDYKNNIGKVILTSSGKNKDIDTVIIYKYNYYVVSYNNSFENELGIKFGMKFNGNDKIGFEQYKITNIYNSNGEKINLDEIETNDAIRII